MEINSLNNQDNITSINDILDKVYPIGSIYMTINPIDPKSLFGGEWEPWGTGRVPVGIDIDNESFNSVEKIGGEERHWLSTTEIPTHRHYIEGRDFSLKINNHSHTIPTLRQKSAALSGTGYKVLYYDANGGGGISTTSDGEATYVSSSSGYSTETAGSGGDHNNLQPYITCYMWKRTC